MITYPLLHTWLLWDTTQKNTYKVCLGKVECRLPPPRAWRPFFLQWTHNYCFTLKWSFHFSAMKRKGRVMDFTAKFLQPNGMVQIYRTWLSNKILILDFTFWVVFSEMKVTNWKLSLTEVLTIQSTYHAKSEIHTEYSEYCMISPSLESVPISPFPHLLFWDQEIAFCWVFYRSF